MNDTFEPPIQNLDAFDVLGVRKDGGIDAEIVAATAIDGSPATLKALGTKVRNYIAELTSEQFLEEYPNAPGRTRILILANSSIDVAARGLIQVLAAEAKSAGISLETRHVVA